jgi:glycosyltransferase involved in cell wall biosynthesis
MSIKISACLVVHNEEKLLPRCLNSIKGVVDEIVFVHDGPCNDRGLEIARDYGAKIYVQPRVGEAERHRPFSYQEATGDWILQIDADEFLGETARKYLRKLTESKLVDGYSFHWPYFNGKRYLAGPFAKEFKNCLFRKSKLFMIGITHEYPRTYGTLEKRIDILLEHRPLYNNFTWRVFYVKWIRWAKIQAQQIVEIDSAPKFNVGQHNNLIFYYKRQVRYPVMVAFTESSKLALIYLKRGVLWSGPKTWQIALMSIFRVLMIDYYIFRIKHGYKISI